MRGNVLIVDDDKSMCEMLETDIRQRDLGVSSFPSAEEAFEVLRDGSFDVVLTDLNLPGINGIELCERIAANRPDIPVIVITAFGSLDTAVAAIRAGAYDFVTKPIDLEILGLALDRAIRHRMLQEKVRLLSEEIDRTRRFDELIGMSPPMQQLYGQMSRLADSEASVLIAGESGTGKEVVARALHRKSRRCDRPFVAINCSALPENLLESELFGHAKGAFTDARTDRTGLLQQADGGTLLLDEIGEFPLALQPKLLRVLEQRTVRPVGGSEELHFDVRLLSSTNRDLESAMAEGKFREDLFFRINVVQLEVPPLRSRGTDILLLAQHFLEHFSSRSGRKVVGITDAVGEKLLDYPWPGNVRELRNAIERAVALTCYEELAVEDLPEKVRSYQASHMLLGGDDPTELLTMAEVERRYVRHVLEAAGGNKTLAARILGFDRKTLYRKLQDFGEGEKSGG
jgi:DNA-binding NtrC family response regulator